MHIQTELQNICEKIFSDKKLYEFIRSTQELLLKQNIESRKIIIKRAINKKLPELKHRYHSELEKLLRDQKISKDERKTRMVEFWNQIESMLTDTILYQATDENIMKMLKIRLLMDWKKKGELQVTKSLKKQMELIDPVVSKLGKIINDEKMNKGLSEYQKKEIRENFNLATNEIKEMVKDFFYGKINVTFYKKFPIWYFLIAVLILVVIPLYPTLGFLATLFVASCGFYIMNSNLDGEGVVINVKEIANELKITEQELLEIENNKLLRKIEFKEEGKDIKTIYTSIPSVFDSSSLESGSFRSQSSHSFMRENFGKSIFQNPQEEEIDLTKEEHKPVVKEPTFFEGGYKLSSFKEIIGGTKQHFFYMRDHIGNLVEKAHGRSNLATDILEAFDNIDAKPSLVRAKSKSGLKDISSLKLFAKLIVDGKPLEKEVPITHEMKINNKHRGIVCKISGEPEQYSLYLAFDYVKDGFHDVSSLNSYREHLKNTTFNLDLYGEVYSKAKMVTADASGKVESVSTDEIYEAPTTRGSFGF